MNFVLNILGPKNRFRKIPETVASLYCSSSTREDKLPSGLLSRIPGTCRGPSLQTLRNCAQTRPVSLHERNPTCPPSSARRSSSLAPTTMSVTCYVVYQRPTWLHYAHVNKVETFRFVIIRTPSSTRQRTRISLLCMWQLWKASAVTVVPN